MRRVEIDAALARDLSRVAVFRGVPRGQLIGAILRQGIARDVVALDQLLAQRNLRYCLRHQDGWAGRSAANILAHN